MKKSDLMPLFRLLSDEKVMEHIEPAFDLARTEAFLESAGLCDDPLIWAVEDDGAFIGYVIYHDYIGIEAHYIDMHEVYRMSRKNRT